MGLALDLWNAFELRLGGEGIRVKNYGEGTETLATDGTNLIATILRDELARMGLPVQNNFEITCHNAIPVASGCGSSSTGVLAGVIFSQAIAAAHRGEDPAELDRQEILARSVEIEGHGDNVAPALLGGFVIVVPDETGVLTQRIPHVPTKTVVCVPKFTYFTSEARAALPNQYSKSDAIFNIGRAMLVAEALRSGDDDMLRRSMNDRIHEPYRLPAIPGAPQAKEAAMAAGAICVSLSGAGPGIIAFARGGYDRIGRGMKLAFAEADLEARYWILDATDQGATIGRLPV